MLLESCSGWIFIMSLLDVLARLENFPDPRIDWSLFWLFENSVGWAILVLLCVEFPTSTYFLSSWFLLKISPILTPEFFWLRLVAESNVPPFSGLFFVSTLSLFFLLVLEWFAWKPFLAEMLILAGDLLQESLLLAEPVSEFLRLPLLVLAFELEKECRCFYPDYSWLFDSLW